MTIKQPQPIQQIDPLATEPEIGATILAQTGVLLVALDAEGRVVHFNNACENATGYTRREVIGEHVWDRLLVSEQVAEIKAVFRELVDTPGPNDHENYWVTKSGTLICVHWFNTSIRDGDGHVRWVIGAGLDITGKKRAQLEIEEHAARLNAVFETAVEGIITIDTNGIIESINPAAERLFGYNAQEAIGRNVNMLMPSPYREEHDQYIEHYVRTGEAKVIGTGREMMGLRKDGTTFPMELAISEVLLPNRRLFTGIIRDTSERRLAEKRDRERLAEHAHAARLAALGEMASGIAHELNQPLTAIVSFADACQNLFKKEQVPEDVISDALNQISEQGIRAGNIIRRLRQFVKTGALDQEIVNLNAVIKDVLAMVSHELHMHEVKVKLRLGKQLPGVWADKLQIEQVVLNLVWNAIEAMESGELRRLDIETIQHDAKIEVRISDTGCGFTDNMAHLFTAFYTTKEKGTGLGLSISHRIIEAHSGKLLAKPNTSGGATFSFTLPIMEAIY
jgi:two-component system sensor kinase FixL